MEIQPSSRYVLCGLDGMFEGRWPDLRHASHSLKLFSFSFRTIVLAAAKGSMPLKITKHTAYKRFKNGF